MDRKQGSTMVSSAPLLYGKGFLGIEFCSPNLLFQDFPVLLVALGDEVVPPTLLHGRLSFGSVILFLFPAKTLPLGTNPLGT